MKILVVSDTHGDIHKCTEILEKEKSVDLFIHLGDYTKDVNQIKEKFNITILNVRGNCDYLDYNTPEEEIIKVNGKRILLTHGHRYGVKRGLQNLYYRSKELELDAVFFGHTHIPTLRNFDNILFFNPGSISRPRGRNLDKTYGLITIEDNIKPNIIKVKD
ncbi:metallophosphoesterase [Thermohalobacter berrensis]|uniref:Phosphoesterase n=1 Tax=Thermohalobacter berrensis TaxID=99594 RepID=A0A419SUT5_9FIRM|nr:metallophosphoesterase [Thermohalobacter berrensis]RKD28983.1 hypothetical protein BET03_06460 [Thermohalobacter berrensis]